MFFTKRQPTVSIPNDGITCKSCVNYLCYVIDKRIVLKNKSIRGGIAETHICKRMHPQKITPYFKDSYGILNDLFPCDLYKKKPVGEDEEGRGMMYSYDN